MSTVYDFEMKTIDGGMKKLTDYKGKAMLIVNVASKCGLTPQYAGLEALYKEFGGKGLAVLGFPANEFAGQEPAEDAEIKTFCSTKYDVSFDMFSKVKVKGDGMHPLFALLTDASSAFGGEIKWNFNKFLVGKDGAVIARFEPKTEPSEMKEAIAKALG
jgi:glutathione peroxidase